MALFGFGAVATAAAAGHPAERHVGHWSANPRDCPSQMVTDAPIIGNGELGATVGGALPYIGVAGHGTGGGSKGYLQNFYLGQMDFWTEQAIGSPPGWTHVAPGHATLSFVPQGMDRWPTPPPPAPSKPAQPVRYDISRHGESVVISENGTLAAWSGKAAGCVASEGKCQAAMLATPIDMESLPATFWVERGPHGYGADSDVGLCASDADVASGSWIGWQAGKSWLYRAGGHFKTDSGGNSTACPFEQCGEPYGQPWGDLANITTIVHSSTVIEFLLDGRSQGKRTLVAPLPPGVVGCVTACSGATMNLNAKPSGHDPGGSGGITFEATQELYAARANTTVTVTDASWGSPFVVTTSSMVPKATNALLTVFKLSHDAMVTVSLSTGNMYGLPIRAGAATAPHDALWLERHATKWVHNSAVMTECSGLSLNLGLTKVFSFDPVSKEIGPLQNATAKAAGDPSQCMWLAGGADETQLHQPRNTSIITSSDCGRNGTRWRYDTNSSSISSLDFPGVCVCYYCGSSALPAYSPSVVVPCPCAGADADDADGANQSSYDSKWKVIEVSFQGVTGVTLVGALGAPSPLAFLTGPQCLGIVRRNINISLGMASAVSEVSKRSPLPFKATSLAVANPDSWVEACVYGASKCPNTYSTSASYALEAGIEYVVRVAVRTTRGDHHQKSALDFAVSDARTIAYRTAAATHAADWARFWNRSSVDLGLRRGSKSHSLEGFYYGAQYMLNSFSKSEGGVIPGLLGPWSAQDPVGWADGITMDYNAEANFYGSASSNHPQNMHPYFPTVSAAIPMGRERARLPDWSFGGHEAAVQNLFDDFSAQQEGVTTAYTAVGTTGDQTEAMGCACAGMQGYPWCRTDIHNRTCPKAFGGFEGIEFPLQLGAFATMHCSPDGAMRSVAAMAAAPYVEYFEHTQNMVFLKEEAYPFVKEVALFYASYLRLDPNSGRYEVPHACAQEFCGERQLPSVTIPGPPGSHGCPQPPQRSPTIDLAFAEYVFKKAAAWSEILGVDADRRAQWQSMAGKLAAYPRAQHHDCEMLFPWAAASNCTGWSEATNTDTNTSAELHANYNWPIANFAPIHPTGLVSLSSDNVTKLLARNTAWMLAMDSNWAPVNGLCLAWPSAARMADRFDTYPFNASVLMDAWESALAAHMQPNFWPSLGGGGLEQAGATLAVNELLFQSFEGFLRFFPGWPLGERACFTTLRGVGAFLVSGCVDERGDITGISVVSEVGGTCEFVRFSDAVSVRSDDGKEVAVESVAGGRLRFATVAGGHYSLTARSDAQVKQ